MPPKPLIAIEDLDLENVVFDKDAIRERNHQRHEMEMLDRIIHYDSEEGLVAGLKYVREDEFWCRGHFPERPILPGVMMLEAAGQICSLVYTQETKGDAVIGFASADNVKFRGTVVPGDILVIQGRMEEIRARRAQFACQGYVGPKLVFEARIVGMPI